jgi:HSP20 family protein
MRGLRDALRDLPDPAYADLLEREDAYLLVVDLPGASADSVRAETSAGRLTIEASRPKPIEGDTDVREEGRSVFLDVELPLPPDATGEGAEGTVADGVLELTLPKRNRTATTAISIGE